MRRGPAWSPRWDLIAFGWTDNDAVACDPGEPSECEFFDRPLLGVRVVDQPGRFRFHPSPGLRLRPGLVTWRGGARIRARRRTGWNSFSGVDGDIEAVTATSGRTVVGGPETDSQPAWSPDGTRSYSAAARVRRALGLGCRGSNPTRILSGKPARLATRPAPLARPGRRDPRARVARACLRAVRVVQPHPGPRWHFPRATRPSPPRPTSR